MILRRNLIAGIAAGIFTLGAMAAPAIAGDYSRLSTVLMIDDDRFPWVLLVPRVNGVEEFHHLSSAHRSLLAEEISTVTEGMQAELPRRRSKPSPIGTNCALRI